MWHPNLEKGRDKKFFDVCRSKKVIPWGKCSDTLVVELELAELMQCRFYHNFMWQLYLLLLSTLEFRISVGIG